MSQYLPLLFLLACPIMMIFMMGGMHSRHGSSGGTDTGGPGSSPTPDQLTQSRVAELERQVQTLHDQLTAQATEPHARRSPDGP
ncbi:MAG TPA: DUF2933 domain-containing protein [Actinomycetes bacterium]|nr:DUF2933 domain-containing protein [Actinomycetes bacterium]